MFEGFVCFVHQGGEFFLRERGRYKGEHDLDSEFLVGQSLQATPLVFCEGRPCFWQVESAVGCEACEQDVVERECGGFASGTYITHFRSLYGAELSLSRSSFSAAVCTASSARRCARRSAR